MGFNGLVGVAVAGQRLGRPAPLSGRFRAYRLIVCGNGNAAALELDRSMRILDETAKHAAMADDVQVGSAVHALPSVFLDDPGSFRFKRYNGALVER